MIPLIRFFLPLPLGAGVLLAVESAPPPTCPLVGADAVATDQTPQVDRMLKEIDTSGKHPIMIDSKQRQAILDVLPGATPAEIDSIISEIQERIHAELANKIRASAGGTTTECTTTLTDDKGKISKYVISTQNGKPWLVASRDCKEIFSGPVGTPEERALVPEELLVGAQGLGLDFNVEHKSDGQSESLKLRTGGEGKPSGKAQ